MSQDLYLVESELEFQQHSLLGIPFPRSTLHSMISSSLGHSHVLFALFKNILTRVFFVELISLEFLLTSFPSRIHKQHLLPPVIQMISYDFTKAYSGESGEPIRLLGLLTEQ